MVAKHRAAIHVDDHQQPDPLDLELLLEPERIAHDDLEPHVEAVAVEFDDVQRLHGRRCRSGVAWHSLEVGRSGETSAAREAVQTLCAQCARKRPNAHPLRIEWVVGRGEPELAALKQEIGVHVLEASQSSTQAKVCADLVQRDALVTNALNNPRRQDRMGLQQQAKGAGSAAARAIAAELDSGGAHVVVDTGVGNETAPAEHAPVLVGRGAVIEQAVQLTAIDPRTLLDLRHRDVGHVQLDGLPAR